MNFIKCFWSKVEIGNGCWNWRGTRRSDGYGKIRINGNSLYAHRLSYELLRGPIPKGLTIDHLCSNTSCVNPYHLEAISRGENTLRGEAPTAINKRKTRCLYGHPLSGDNLLSWAIGRGQRRCKICYYKRRNAWEKLHKYQR